MFKFCFRYGLVPVFLEMAEALHSRRHRHSGFDSVFFFLPRKGETEDMLHAVLAGPGEAVCVNASDKLHDDGNGWSLVKRELDSSRDASPFLAAVPLGMLEAGSKKAKLDTEDLVIVSVDRLENDSVQEPVSWSIALTFSRCRNREKPVHVHETDPEETPPGLLWVRPDVKRVMDLAEQDAYKTAVRLLPDSFPDAAQLAQGCIYRPDCPYKSLEHPLRYALYGRRGWNGLWTVAATDGKEILLTDVEEATLVEGADPDKELMGYPMLVRPSTGLMWALRHATGGASTTLDTAPMNRGERLWYCRRNPGRSFWYMQYGAPDAAKWPVLDAVVQKAVTGSRRWIMQVEARDALQAAELLTRWKKEHNVYTVLLSRDGDDIVLAPSDEGEAESMLKEASLEEIIRVPLAEPPDGDDVMLQVIDHMIRAFMLAGEGERIVLECFAGTAGESDRPPLITHTPVEDSLRPVDAKNVHLCMERTGPIRGCSMEAMLAARLKAAKARISAAEAELPKKDDEPAVEDFFAEL